MLRNRKEQDEPKLTGVNRVADPSKLKLGTFQALQNWIPAKRYKIKKKRGVEALVDSPPTPVVPTNCGVCQSAFPEAQDLPSACCYINNDWGDLSNNDAGSLSYAAPDGTFWCTVSEQTGVGSGPYPVATPTQTWYLLEPTDPVTDCDLQEVTAVPLDGFTANFEATQTAQAGRSGHSDEKSYVLGLSSITPSTYGSNSVVYFGEISGSSVISNSFNMTQVYPWTKYGTEFFTFIYGFANSLTYLVKWTIPGDGNESASNQLTDAAGVVQAGSPIPGATSVANIRAMHATATYLYVLVDQAEFGNPRIYKINKSTLEFIEYFEITNSTFDRTFQFHVFSDDLIFLLADDASLTLRIGFLKTSDSSVTLIDETGATACTNASYALIPTGFVYSANYFYLAGSGFGTGASNVSKLGPLLCPGTTSFWES